MDVQTQPRRARIFSILNDNDCPSFVVRQQQQSRSLPSKAPSSSSPSASPRQTTARPSLLRQAGYTRTSSFSSAGSPPLLRQSSHSSMDSSPSPITPAFNYVDNNMLPYDPLRQDLVGYLPSPTTITPFLEQQMILNPMMPDPYAAKAFPPIMPAQYPVNPAPLPPPFQHLPAPTSVTPSKPLPIATAGPPAIQSKPSPPTAALPTNTKKNKYPCPYAQAHNCQATFTTSGHAARHGKKHTGEKGVHCPICNKAFTRKDNMKQHERTHKGSQSGSNGEDGPRRSKAAVSKDAQKAKPSHPTDSMHRDASRRSSMIHSPLSEVTSLAPTAVETPLNLEETQFYQDPSQLLMPIQTIPEGISPNSLYPPFNDDLVLAHSSSIQQPFMTKLPEIGLGNSALMPPLVRGYSDLDTLAQAAESFGPYYPQNL